MHFNSDNTCWTLCLAPSRIVVDLRLLAQRTPSLPPLPPPNFYQTPKPYEHARSFRYLASCYISEDVTNSSTPLNILLNLLSLNLWGLFLWSLDFFFQFYLSLRLLRTLCFPISMSSLSAIVHKHHPHSVIVCSLNTAFRSLTSIYLDLTLILIDVRTTSLVARRIGYLGYQGSLSCWTDQYQSKLVGRLHIWWYRHSLQFKCSVYPLALSFFDYNLLFWFINQSRERCEMCLSAHITPRLMPSAFIHDFLCIISALPQCNVGCFFTWLVLT